MATQTQIDLAAQADKTVTTVKDEADKRTELGESPVPSQTETAAALDVAPKRPMLEVLSLLSNDRELAQSYARDVVAQEVARATFDEDWRLAKVFAWSGVFADIKGVTERQAISAAMAKIQLGRNWNMSAADAMQFVYFTNGRPSVMTEILASKMRDGGWDWDLEFEYEPAEDKTRKRKKCVGCTLWPKRWNPETKKYDPVLDRKGNQVSVTFNKDDADNALIWEKGKQIPLSQKWNYESWPEDMYYWRALSRLRRRYATNILSGVLTMDEAGELPPARETMRATIALDQVHPSAEPNRGHDDTAGRQPSAGPLQPVTTADFDHIIEGRADDKQVPSQQPGDAGRKGGRQGELLNQ